MTHFWPSAVLLPTDDEFSTNTAD